MNKAVPYIFSVILSIAVIVAYSNTLHSPFVFDDELNIVRNTALQVESFDLDSLKKGISSKQPSGTRPVANLSFALNYLQGGYNPLGFHVVNILIHLLTSLVVFRLFSWYCRKTGFRSSEALAISFIAASLWALNPMQVSSVTYIVQRMTSLCGLFFTGSLLAYVHGRDLAEHGVSGHSKIRITALYLGAFVLWVLAMLTKEIAAIMPLVLLLHELFFFTRASGPGLFSRKRIYFWFVLLAFVLGLFFLGPSLPNILTAGYAERSFTLGERLLTQPRVIVTYISLFLLPLPSRLTLFHDFQLSSSLFSPLATLMSLAALVLLTGGALAGAKKYRLPAFGILWMLLCLVIESSILPLELIFEHRFYLPSMGFALALAVFSFQLCGTSRVYKRVYYGFWLSVSVALLLLTFVRNQDWQDSVTLYADAAQKSPNLVRVVNGLAVEYSRSGKKQAARETFDQALRLDPDNIVVLANLFVFYTELRDPDTAEQYLVRLKESISNGFFHCNQTMNLNLIAKVLAKERRYEDIIAVLEPLARCGGRSVFYYDNLAVCYSWLGNHLKAIENYTKAVAMEPANPNYLFGLAWSYAQLGDKENGVPAWRRLLDSSPPPELASGIQQLKSYYSTE